MDVVSSSVLGIPLVVYTISRMGHSHSLSSQAVTNAIHENPALYAGQMLLGFACSILGGYVAAWLAKRDELLNGGFSSWLCVTLGLYAIATGKDPNPHWLQMLLLLAGPAAAILGGDLMRRLRRSRLQPV